MTNEEILKCVEDRDIEVKRSWYIHATRNNINTVQRVLNEGITCAHLRGQKGNAYNGKYYISLYTDSSDKELKRRLIHHPKFVIDGINPHHAVYRDSDAINFRKIFAKTRIPLRTSVWDGEYQQYLRINPSHFVAIEYGLAFLFSNDYYANILPSFQDELMRKRIEFLKGLIEALKENDSTLPIYDLLSRKEINTDKVMSLNL